MELSEQQKQVFEQIKKFMDSDASIFILQGYAGTGKTTMIQYIAEYLKDKTNLFLMAPTGRAARVLSDKTNQNAYTIHKGIYRFSGLSVEEKKELSDNRFKMHFPIRKVEKGYATAIVDEASMLCSQTIKHEIFMFGTDNIMNDLLTFVRPSFGGKLILVGDPAQLPPVGESISNALNPEFFENKGLKVMQASLTEVLRQKKDSLILKNAMQIRDLLSEDNRNRLVFEEKVGEVEALNISDFLDKYFEKRNGFNINDSVIICFANQTANDYNKSIRQRIFNQENPEIQKGDILMVCQNNYKHDIMNGEFVKVTSVGTKTYQSAPVYIQNGATKEKHIFKFGFQNITYIDPSTKEHSCYILLNLLYSDNSSLSLDEMTGLFINFCMRNPHLRKGSEEFANAIMEDEYFNCLKAKFGYAVTGHKCQGGEWEKAFVDYSKRTGLSTDCLRWAYTATTRAKDSLYFTNLPHITPFSKFRIEQLQKCSKLNEEFRQIKNTNPSPFHKNTDPNYLHAKFWCIMENMEYSIYKINSIVSKPYLEIYFIQTPDGIERYDLFYKKGGVFSPAKPQTPSKHSVLVSLLLNREYNLPIEFNYTPQSEIHSKLYNLIRSICDTLNILITNVVEHSEDYSVNYYFHTSNTFSYIKFYIDQSGFITYAKPMSLIGEEDFELNKVIEELSSSFI